MSVHVVTDSSSCLPADVAAAAGVTVLGLHTAEEEGEKTTAGLGQLELTAMYARLLERGSDAGVVAIHLSKDLSATWANAKTAAGIFDNSVRVLDTRSAGMVLGFAALSAAEAAQSGADLDEVEKVAQDVIDAASLWLYVHKPDTLRKGGRLSAGQAFWSTALVTRPIFQLVDGKIAAVSKARTQSKAMEKLLSLVMEHVAPGGTAAIAEAMARAKEEHHDEVKARQRAKAKAMLDLVNRKKAEAANDGEDLTGEWNPAEALNQRLEEATIDGLRAASSGARTVRIAIQHAEMAELAEDLREKITTLSEEIHAANPEVHVDVQVMELSSVIVAHTGPGALGIAVAVDAEEDPDSTGQ